MKEQIQQFIIDAVANLNAAESLALSAERMQINRPKERSHGDFACNIAMVTAKQAGLNPRELAQKIIDHLPAEHFSQIEIAGPGFINFYLQQDALHSVIATILKQQQQFGLSNIGQQQKVLVEFVSANPTGPLHVGHGRGACYGAAVADLLASQGFAVAREYYVNDAGRQMDILATSVWLRYLGLCGEVFAFPSNGYKGDYIIDFAKNLHAEVGESLKQDSAAVFAGVPADECAGGDKEAHINALIENCKALLGDDAYKRVHKLALDAILDDIKDDLAGFGITMQNYFSEQALVDSGALAQGIEKLKAKGLLYEQEGAWWFKATDYGDEKDRVLVRANGQHTYFATDFVYHINKFVRGFTKIIDIFGADHHGYVARIKAAVEAVEHDRDAFSILLVQFATLYRGSERVQMSTRSGEFVTLRELREEIGKDATRFFYVMRKADQHMDFDLELAKSKSNQNPVYYIQYAYARVCSVMRQLAEKGLSFDEQQGLQHLDQLDSEHEKALITSLNKYPELLQKSALRHEPHTLANYLRELANDFHAYYNASQVLVEAVELRQARLCLCLATRQVIANGLELLGVSTPERM